jgi:dipeptide/tripeptide permease
VFFFLGQLLLTMPNIPVFYAGLVCMVIGNGFFKPNVSSMVGNLYEQGSPLKDRAYVIFYMGINVGAALSPIVAEFINQFFGFRPAFAVAAGGIAVSMCVFWGFKRYVLAADRKSESKPKEPTNRSKEPSPMDLVPEWKRIGALIVIFIIVIVFWMIFHQNGSTLTLWADENTDWNVSGIISNAINPLWIIVLSLPLAWFWGWLNQKGLEPSTPTKMAIGMVLAGCSLVVLYFAALSGEYTKPAVPVLTPAIQTSSMPGQVWIELPKATREALGIKNTPVFIEVKFKDTQKGEILKKKDAWAATALPGKEIRGTLCRIESVESGKIMVAPVYKVSPWWLVLSYFLISLAELMLSPMGLALVHKVSPQNKVGLMMGGWFLATAIGNKLTGIGVYWDVWSHAQFFLVLTVMAFAVAVLLLMLISPLKKAMPGA